MPPFTIEASAPAVPRAAFLAASSLTVAIAIRSVFFAVFEAFMLQSLKDLSGPAAQTARGAATSAARINFFIGMVSSRWWGEAPAWSEPPLQSFHLAQDEDRRQER